MLLRYCRNFLREGSYCYVLLEIERHQFLSLVASSFRVLPLELHSLVPCLRGCVHSVLFAIGSWLKFSKFL